MLKLVSWLSIIHSTWHSQYTNEIKFILLSLKSRCQTYYKVVSPQRYKDVRIQVVDILWINPFVDSQSSWKNYFLKEGCTSYYTKLLGELDHVFKNLFAPCYIYYEWCVFWGNMIGQVVLVGKLEE